VSALIDLTVTGYYERGGTRGQLERNLAGIGEGRMAKVDEWVGPAVFSSGQTASFCTVADGGFVCW
jgi:hypothetical protein